jgi:hypothetical protein
MILHASILTRPGLISFIFGSRIEADTPSLRNRSSRSIAGTTSIALDRAIKVIDVVADGSSDLDYRRLTAMDEALYCRQGHTEIFSSGG